MLCAPEVSLYLKEISSQLASRHLKSPSKHFLLSIPVGIFQVWYKINRYSSRLMLVNEGGDPTYSPPSSSLSSPSSSFSSSSSSLSSGLHVLILLVDVVKPGDEKVDNGDVNREEVERPGH